MGWAKHVVNEREKQVFRAGSVLFTPHIPHKADFLLKKTDMSFYLENVSLMLFSECKVIQGHKRNGSCLNC